MQLPSKFSNCKRFSFSKSGGKNAHHSLVVRSNSSFQLEALAKSAREKRRSSSPTHEVMEVVAAIRAEAEQQEVAAKAISSASLEEALKKIQALKNDVELASHHSQHSSSPGMSAEPSQVEICLTEPTFHPSEAVSVQVSA